MNCKRLRTRQGVFAVIALLGVLMLTGCGQTTLVLPSSRPTLPATPPPVAASPESLLKNQADTAWNAGNMAEAERLYGIVSRHAGTTAPDRAAAFERLARAAMANKHPHTALDALERWKAQTPGAEKTWPWLATWRATVASMPAADQNRLLLSIWNDANQPVVLRAVAGESLLLTADAATAPQLAPQLGEVYNRAAVTERRLMEQVLLDGLLNSPEPRVAALAAMTELSQDHAFPWSLVLLEQARRAKKAGRPDAADWLTRIDFPSVFATSGLLEAARRGDASYAALFAAPGGAPGGAEGTASTATPPVASIPLHGGCYAMTLPMSGPYASIGWKVAKGASVAQKELAQSGLNVEVMVINTEAADWLDQLAALPEQCVTVGGPMQPDAYTALKGRDLTRQRAFFTFLSRLDGTDEGTAAWRFFSSPEDQVAAVLGFARQAGVNSYAALYPEDNFGQRMTDLFMQGVQRSGASMSKTATYAPSDQVSWNKTVNGFVGSYMVNKTPVPSTSFQAVFLPDSWQAAEILIPYLFFHGEDRLLLMGTALWEQGLAGKTGHDVRNYSLAVFPGAWNSATPTAAAARLMNGLSGEETGESGADFWMGIGYDFVRFASALNLKPGWTSAAVNSRLADAARLDWSMAPLSWSGGKASQALFLFTPAENGFVLADVDQFRERLEQTRTRHANRVSAAKGGKK